MTTFTRLKDLGQWLSGGTPSREDEGAWEGDIPWLSAKDIDRDVLRPPTAFVTPAAAAKGSTLVPAGTVLMIVRGMALAHGLPVVLTVGPAAFNQDLRALVPGGRHDSRFLRYSLRGNRGRLASHIDRAAHGTARVVDSVYGERVWTPDQHHQRAVADFLDRESERVAALGSRLGSAEIRVTELARARITARLEADRDSHALGRVGWQMSLLIGHAFESQLFVHSPEDGVRLLRGANLSARGTRWDDTVYWPHALVGKVEAFCLKAGDLVVGLNRPWVSGGLRLARIREEDLPALLLQRVGCLRRRPGARLSQDYLALWMRTDRFRHEVGDASAVTFPMLEPARMLSWRLPVPSSEDQRAAVRAAAAEGRLALWAQDRLRAMADRLTEYRDALITEAVTGQLDITKLSESQMDERVHAAVEGRLDEAPA